MYPKRKRQNNFICNPDLPLGPIYDSTVINENFITKYKIVDLNTCLIEEDVEAYKTIQRLRKLFTQFQERSN